MQITPSRAISQLPAVIQGSLQQLHAFTSTLHSADSSFSCSSSFTILLTSLCENKNVCCHIFALNCVQCSYSDTLFIEVLFPYFPFKHRIFVKRNHIKLLGKMILSLDYWWCWEENCKRNCCQLWVAPGVREGLQGSSAWCDFRYEDPESLHIHLSPLTNLLSWSLMKTFNDQENAIQDPHGRLRPQPSVWCSSQVMFFYWNKIVPSTLQFGTIYNPSRGKFWHQFSRQKLG